jgi:hypothetical protein
MAKKIVSSAINDFLSNKQQGEGSAATDKPSPKSVEPPIYSSVERALAGTSTMQRKILSSRDLKNEVERLNSEIAGLSDLSDTILLPMPVSKKNVRVKLININTADIIVSWESYDSIPFS